MTTVVTGDGGSIGSRVVDDRRSFADTRLAAAELGWRATTAFDDPLARSDDLPASTS